MKALKPVASYSALHTHRKVVLLFLFLILYFLLLATGCNRADPISEVVKTENGWVKGSFDSESGIYSFKGIPYADSPIDSLRWRAPRPAHTWKDTLYATHFGDICMQHDPVPFMMWTKEFITPDLSMSEDCLTLNIWTSEGNPSPRRPVILFIHGGGFTSGSGAVPIYDGTNMAEKGVVFVTINYRVGIFGFLAHKELTESSTLESSGNYGLLDQIEALKWVRNNIESFGGDPNNVTIAGQSAGSFSANYLTISPLAENLFHRVIAESGAAFLPSNRLGTGNSLEEAQETGKRIAEYFKTESLDALQSIPADSLLNVQTNFGPVIDGKVIPGHMFHLYMEGEFHDVPVLTGWNEDEGLMMGPVLSADQYRESVRSIYDERSDKILQLFPAQNDSIAAESQFELEKLTTFGLQSWKWAQMVHDHGSSNVYLYHFSRDLPHTPDQYDFGAFHTGEVPYAYANLEQSNRPWSETDRQLSEAMASYWASFARDGVPNFQGGPAWPPFDPESARVIHFSDSVYNGDMPVKPHLELLDDIYTERVKKISNH